VPIPGYIRHIRLLLCRLYNRPSDWQRDDLRRQCDLGGLNLLLFPSFAGPAGFWGYYNMVILNLRMVLIKVLID